MEFSGFDWDEGNRTKCRKHGLSIALIESLFREGLAILPDQEHSQKERRFKAVGRTKEGRYVFVAFTLRGTEDSSLIRPISARYMHEKESRAYEKENPGLQNRSRG
jgi:uncharacterized protein